MPVANGSASTAGNDVLTNQLAGMSKHQLYEVMLQMKVYVFCVSLLSPTASKFLDFDV